MACALLTWRALWRVRQASTIDAANDWVYAELNNGVYRCGFARSQQAYVTAAQAPREHGTDCLNSCQQTADPHANAIM